MTEIPKQLQNEEFGLCKIHPNSKIPLGVKWNENPYKHNDYVLLEHLQQGGNYGVIAGYGGLRILDIDNKELAEELIKKLNTFAVKTCGGTYHFYFLSDYETSHNLKEGLGEYRAKGQMVVGCGSYAIDEKKGHKGYYTIAQDLPIKELNETEIKELLKPYLKEEITTTTNSLIKENGEVDRSRVEYKHMCRLLTKGKTKEEIWVEMCAFDKWKSRDEKYKENMYSTAKTFIEERKKRIQEIEPPKEYENTIEIIEKEDSQYEAVKLFVNDFDKYCYNNKFSGVLAFHTILGQKIKEIFIFKNGCDKIDQRINIFEIRPSGTGKGKSMNFLLKVGEGIGLVCKNVNDFSDSALLGSYEKGTRKQETIKLKGIFEKSDLITCEEAESLFETQTYKEGTIRHFNTAFNTINTPSNKIYKALRYGEIEFNPTFSGYFTSVMFQDFNIKIKCGFFQRQLVFIQEELIQQRLLNLKEDIKRVSFSTDRLKRQKIETNENTLIQTYKEIFDNLKKFAENTEFEEEEGLNEYIKNKLEELFIQTSKVSNSVIMGVLFSFLSRWIEHLYKLSFHSAILRQSKIVQKKDIDYAFSIMIKCFDNLLFFLEKNTEENALYEDKDVNKLRYVFGCLNNQPKIRANELVSAMKQKFHLSTTTIYKLLNEWVERECLKKEEGSSEKGKEVYYAKPL